MKRLFQFALVAAAVFAGVPAFAQNTTGLVVQTCGTVPLAFIPGNPGPFTVDVTGKICTSGGAGGSPGGSNTQVQFNDSSAFGGSAAFTFNKTTGVTTQSPTAPTTAGGSILNFNSAAVSALPTVPHTNSQRIIGADNQDAAGYIDSFGPNDGSLLSPRSIINLRAARGTGAVPLASNSGDELGRLSGRGGLATGFTNSVASVSFIAAENFTSTNQGALVGFRTTALGTPGQGTNATPPLVGAFGPSGTLIVGKTVTLGSLTASISGPTMTVTAQSGTPLAVGQFINLSAAGVTDAEIIALGSGVGGTGTYTVAPSEGTVASLSTTAYKFFALDAANDLGAGWGAFQSGAALYGSTSGRIKMVAPLVAGTNQITWPAGTTDFSATGGASQVLKQTSAGAAITVAQVAAGEVSGLAAVATSGSASDLSTGTLPCAQMGNSGFGRGKLIGADLNTTADQSITICLPTGSTHYKLLSGSIVISNPSISMTTAVCGVWTGAGKTGTTVVGSSAVGVAMSGLTNNTAGSAGSATSPSPNNTGSAFYAATTLFFACSTAQGATATADVTITTNTLN